MRGRVAGWGDLVPAFGDDLIAAHDYRAERPADILPHLLQGEGRGASHELIVGHRNVRPDKVPGWRAVNAFARPGRSESVQQVADARGQQRRADRLLNESDA